jgi:hypothetical protein
MTHFCLNVLINDHSYFYDLNNDLVVCQKKNDLVDSSLIKIKENKISTCIDVTLIRSLFYP